MSCKIVVPASSANLGPGFDTMAIALSRYMTVTVDHGDGESRNAQEDELSGGGDMVRYAMEYLARSVGRVLPPAKIHSCSDIPVARGMGSSAAALIAGMLAGNFLLDEPLTHDELLNLADHIEGHADNLAAALYGGAVLAVPRETSPLTVQIPVNLDLKAVVMIPKQIGFTTDARAVVPKKMDRVDAVFNSSRCALLVHALESGNPELLSEAMRDRWHQPYRAALYSYMDAVIDAALKVGAYGASLSGSGPTLLALAQPEIASSVADAMRDAAYQQELDSVTQILDIDKSGAQVFVTVS
jgi:homoserine kinase